MQALMKSVGFTDKHTVHSYAEVYEQLLTPRAESSTNVLEIGVYKGGSIKVWETFFQQAHIYGVDINVSKVQASLKLGPRVHIMKADAYDPIFASSLPDFDVVIDDGPHTLVSMKQCLQLYAPKLKRGGILVIEDISDLTWIDELKKEVSPDLHVSFQDRRSLKNRSDDILLIVERK